MSSGRETKIHDPKSQKYGLVTEAGTPVPLKEISVDIRILGFVAEVTSTLLYTNSEDSPIEAEFTFPVDDGSAVFEFVAEIEGRQIIAEIQEREQAKLTYQDAIEKGSTAMLLKEDDTAGDIFQCTLGNLPPKTDAKISFSYVIEVPQEPDGKIKFTLPTVLNPRYSPDAGGVVAAEGATYTAPSNIPYKFNMAGSVRGYHKVLSVTSEHDKLKLEPLGDKTTSIALAEPFKFDHDLSFLVEYEHCFTPQVLLEMGYSNAEGMMKEDVLMVNFYPELKESTTPATGEYVFVIDRSGSMNGRRIQNAKQALFLFLKSLPAGCYFNIVSFGSTYDSLFRGGSKVYDKVNLREALKLQESMDADMGGTQIFEPLKSIFHNKPIKGHPRQLILLTDGEVGNTDKVIGLVKANANNTRVFALGIGSGVSTSLIKGVALAGNGKAEFIADGDRIQSKVISLLKCATQPAFSDIDLKWDLPEGVTPIPIPIEPPNFIGLGERLCLYTLLTGRRLQSSDKTCSVNLSGQCEGKAVNFRMEFTVPSDSQDQSVSVPLHRLGAKTQIKLLETEYSELLNDERSMYCFPNDKMTEIRNRLILLSNSANIISKMTAFVAVDKEAGKQVEGKVVKRQCPIPVATKEFSKAFSDDNWEVDDCCMSRYFRSSSSMFASGAPARLKMNDFGGSGLFPLGKSKTAKAGRGIGLSMTYYRRPPPPPASSVFMRPSASGLAFMAASAVHMRSPCKSLADAELDSELRQPDDQSSKWFEMVSLQEIDGCWLLAKEVTSLLELNEQSLTSLEITKDTCVATTLAVIVWLRSKFQDSHDEWEMIEKKALSWLGSKVPAGEKLDDIFEEVKTKLWPQGLN